MPSAPSLPMSNLACGKGSARKIGKGESGQSLEMSAPGSWAIFLDTLISAVLEAT
jgi:hypothetical protein